MRLSRKILHCSLYMTPKKCYHEWNLRILKNLCYKSATNFSITVWGVPYAQSMNWPGKLRRSIVVNVTHTLDVAEILRPPIQWVSQNICNHSYTGSEILRPFIHWASQKFCKHSYIGCCRNLRPLIHWVWQKFCDLLYNGCRRNSATIHTLGVAEILRPLIHWM